MSYRVQTSDEFWKTCDEVCKEGIGAGIGESIEDIRDTFLRVYTALAPPLGNAIG